MFFDWFSFHSITMFICDTFQSNILLIFFSLLSLRPLKFQHASVIVNFSQSIRSIKFFVKFIYFSSTVFRVYNTNKLPEMRIERILLFFVRFECYFFFNARTVSIISFRSHYYFFYLLVNFSFVFVCGFFLFMFARSHFNWHSNFFIIIVLSRIPLIFQFQLKFISFLCILIATHIITCLNIHFQSLLMAIKQLKYHPLFYTRYIRSPLILRSVANKSI